MRDSLKHWWVFGLLAIFLLAGLQAPMARAEAPAVKEWNLPAFIFMSGPWAAFGLAGKFGMDTGVEELNAAGGIRGLPLKLTWYDTAYDTAKSVQQMSRALDTNPLLTLGPQSDVAVGATMPMLAKEEVFCFSSVGVATTFRKYAPWGIGLFPSQFWANQPGAKYWVEAHPEIKSVVMFTNLLSASIQEQANGIRYRLEKMGIKVLPDIEVPPDVVDFKGVALKALATKADGFVGILSPDQAAKLTIELRKNGIKEGWRIWNYMGCNAPPLYEIGQHFMNNTYVNDYLDPEYPDPRWQALVKKYRQWTKDPKAIPLTPVPFMYITPFVVKQAFEALEITGDPAKLKEERVKLRDYLLKIGQIEGVQGKITLVPEMGGAMINTFMFQIKDGKPGQAILTPPLPYEPEAEAQ